MAQRNTKDFSHYGVLARIEVGPDGVRLVLEDAVRTGPGWQVQGLLTERHYPAASFLPISLMPEHLEEIGLDVAARLAAFFEVMPPRR